MAGKSLTFEEPDNNRFPSLELARKAGMAGGTAPAALNAANEIAVGEFLKGNLPFVKIPWVVEQVLDRHQVDPEPTLATILRVNNWAQDQARCIIAKG